MMNPKKFNELLSNIKTDELALAELFDYYYFRIKLHIQRLYPSLNAEDIAQEFFLQLLRTSNERKYIYRPAAWVYAVCENIAKRVLSESAVEPFDSESIEHVSVDRDDSESVLNRVMANEMLEQIVEEDSKQIIFLHYWEGYTFKEISEMMGASASSIRKKHARIIKKLQKK